MAKTLEITVLVLFGAACVAGGSMACAQGASALVEGRITCNDGNVPARGATVQLVPLATLVPNASSGDTASQTSPSTKSDFFGVYTLSSVAPGTYIVNATLNGYDDDLKLVRTTLKRYTPDQQKSLLGALPQIVVKVGGSVHQDVIIRRAGAIYGRVLADAGGAISQSGVTATLIASDLPSSASPADLPSFSQSAFTDDRGAYRIAGLPPGDYRVSVRVAESFFGTKLGGPQQVTVFPQRTGIADLIVFVPEALKPSEAKVIKVRNGDEIGDTDITIPTGRLHSLAGIVNRHGEPLAGVSVSIETEGSRVVQSDALSMPNGSFQFDLLPDGNYSVIAKTYSSGKETSSRTVSTQIHGSDVTDLVMDVATGTGKP